MVAAAGGPGPKLAPSPAHPGLIRALPGPRPTPTEVLGQCGRLRAPSQRRHFKGQANGRNAPGRQAAPPRAALGCQPGVGGTQAQGGGGRATHWLRVGAETDRATGLNATEGWWEWERGAGGAKRAQCEVTLFLSSS